MNASPQDFSGTGFSALERQIVELDGEGVEGGRRARGSTRCWSASCPPCARPTSGSRTWCRTRATWRSRRPWPRCAAATSSSRFKGLDELSIAHDSVMVEACNTSFQVHLQVDADEFARLYNLAQVLAGPVLAVVVQLAAAVRPAAVGRDAHRALPAVGRHAQPDAAPARRSRRA